MKLMAGVLVGLALASPAVGGDSFPGTEYVSGKGGLQNKVKGTLVVEENEVRFQAASGAVVFSIPMTNVVKASDSKERDEGSFGRKAALGIFASKTEEFLQVDTKSEQGAEAVIFKCKKKTAPGMAAKINFFAKLKEQPPTATPVS
jgi:hypothetical protein